MKPDFLSYLAGRCSELLWKILFFVFLIIGIFVSWKMFSTGSLLTPIFILPCGIILGGLFIKAYLPQIGERIAFSSLFPRKFLKKPPPLLSPYHGMLASGKYQEAMEMLFPLINEYPEDPEIIWLFSNACLNVSGYEGNAFETMEKYFSLTDRKSSPYCVKLLLFYADMSVKYEYFEHLLDIMTNELKQKCYTDLEKNAFRIRLETFERSLENGDR